MIDFELTPNDQKLLDAVREEALVCRKHARYYDEHEEEFPPERLPEADDFRELGALMKVSNLLSLDTVMGQIKKKFSHGFRPEILEGNIRAIQRAYEEVVGE